MNTVLEASSKPGVDVAWNIDGGCGDKIVPVEMSKPVIPYDSAEVSYHDVRV
jgi:hypothetical protein